MVRKRTYRTQSFTRVITTTKYSSGVSTQRIHGVKIISINGKEVAECKTQTMANKIVRALEYYIKHAN